MLVLAPVLLLLICGVGLLAGPGFKKYKYNALFSAGVLLVAAVLTLVATWCFEVNVTLLSYLGDINIVLKQDNLGRLFITVTTIIWLLVGIYSVEYMSHEKEQKRFFGFLLLVYADLICLDSAGNMLSFYFFYELMTVLSLPLVLHERTKEAIMGALKYLFFSMAGAYFALYGIYMLSKHTYTLDFTPGGTLTGGTPKGILLTSIFFIIIGFGAKSGMFPLHAWLPAAHPVAPAPASAGLSAIIVKGGVLGMIRAIFYIVGAGNLKNTWVQYAWMTLSLITVFMGSLLAFREKNFKKRLAYSTVSQASYILFGLSVLEPTAMTGALLHFVFHAIIKCALFMTAGIFIIETGKRNADDYLLIGKTNPITLWAYTFASLGLIGIPPTSGFISKWYLATGALNSNMGVFNIIGPVILLLSALLTAGYLLPIVWNGFFCADPVKKVGLERKAELKSPMVWCVIILALLTLLFGMFPDRLVNFLAGIALDVYGGF